MAYTYLAMQVKTGQFLAELPMQVSGPRTRKLKDFGTASFTLYTRDESCPSDWAQVIDDGYCLMLVVDDADKIVWAGNTTDHTINGDGTVTVNCSTLEGQLAHLNVPDFQMIGVDQAAIFGALIDDFETQCGLGLEKDIANTGTLAAIIVKESDNKNFLACLQEQSTTLYPYEWTIDVVWKDDTFSSVRKIIRMKQHLGNDKTTTNHVFELIVDQGDGESGNVTDFNSVLASTPGNGATRVIATGDGTGALQIRSLLDSTTIDTATEAAGYLPSTYVQNFPGITSAVDIQTAAKVLATNLFGGRRALSLTVKDSAATRITDISLGDYVLVDIEAPNMDVQKTMRVMSMQQENEFEFSPVIVDFGVDALFVPRPDDPAALGTLMNNINSNIAATTGAYNPIATGFDITAANGNSFKLDPSAGTFGAYDSTGKPLGGFDSTGTGFGGVGGGSGGGGMTGSVTSYDAAAELAQVNINGVATSCENDSGMTLFVGDIVAVVDSKAQNGIPLIVSRKRISASPDNPYFTYRVSTDYPKPLSADGFPSGMVVQDYNNLSGMGPDTLFIDTATQQNKYRPSTGAGGTVSAPSGYTWMKDSLYLGGSKYQWHGFMQTANGYPYLFRNDGNAVGGWVDSGALPSNPGAFAGGSWNTRSFSKEPYGSPVACVARITSPTVMGSNAAPYVPVDVDVIVIDNFTGVPSTKTFSVQLAAGGATGSTIDPNTGVFPIVYANGGHVFAEVKMSINGSNNSASKLFYFNMDAPGAPMTQIGTTFDAYMGLDQYFFNYDNYQYQGPGGALCVSEDGEMYTAYKGLLYRRSLTDTGVGTSQYSDSALHAFAQRHLLTDTFFIAYNVLTTDNTANRAGLLWHQTTSSKTVEILGDPSLSSTGGGGGALISRPTQGADDGVVCCINIADVSQFSYTVQRIIPGALFNGQGATPPVTP